MNRDERRSRSPAEPPAVIRTGNGHSIAPRDPDGGGTWLGVNDRGLTIALANVYPPDPPPPAEDTRSRGLLVLDALSCQDIEEVEALLAETEPRAFQPFHLLAFQPGKPVFGAVWDGGRLIREAYADPGLVATSSSRDQATAERVRRAWFDTQAAAHGGYTGALLDRLHRSRHPAPGAWAVSMERSDAATVSMSTVRVGEDTVSFEYTPGPPHKTGPEAPLSLARAYTQAGSPRSRGS